MTNGETVTNSMFAIRKSKGDLSLKDVFGYQKVKYADGSPVIIYDNKGEGSHVYKMINLYGDGQLVSEYYENNIPSVLDNGTVKIANEITDEEIIAHYGGQTQPKVVPLQSMNKTIQMQPDNIEKIKAGTKTATIRSQRQADEIGIPAFSTEIRTIGGEFYNVTNRGLLTIEEAGGKEKMLKDDGAKSENDLMYQQTKDWVNGKGKLYVYDIKPMATISTEQYKGGFENTGKGTPQGDGKDKAMRKVADGFIGELSDLSELPKNSPYDLRNTTTKTSTGTSFKVIGTKNSKYSQDYYNEGSTVSSGKLVTTDDMAKVVMLARNKEFSGKPLSNTTKESISNANEDGAEFIVGDMPGVDSQFIDYLQEIGAKFTIYHTGTTPRITVSAKTQPEDRGQQIDIEPGYGLSKENFEFPEGYDEAMAAASAIGPETKINIYAGTGENAELSNFAVRPFTLDDNSIKIIDRELYSGVKKGIEENFKVLKKIKFQSVEQAFQFMKSLFSEDNDNTADTATKILQTTNGNTLKSLGKKFNLKQFTNPVTEEKSIIWDNHSSDIMKVLIKNSFEQNPSALKALLATGNAELTHTQESPKSKWRTEFPRLLMEVREELKNTPKPPAEFEGELEGADNPNPCGQ